MHVDPEKLMQAVEASRDNRRSTASRLHEEYGSLGIERAETEDNARKKSIAEQRNGIQDQLQQLHYQKITEDAAIASFAGTPVESALAYRQAMQSTMFGADVHGDFANIMRALPVKQREFFQNFVQAPADQRERILSETPLGMRRFLEAKWGEDVEDNPNLEDYFKDHHLPGEAWTAWHPGVNLEDVKLKVVKDTGLDLHSFNMWPKQAGEVARKPYVPLIDPFSASHNTGEIKRQIADIMTGQGYNRHEIDVIPYAATSPGVNLDFQIKYATEPAARAYATRHMDDIVDQAHA
jgi:hypothetical protein